MQPGGHRFEPGILHQPSLMNAGEGCPPEPRSAKAGCLKVFTVPLAVAASRIVRLEGWVDGNVPDRIQSALLQLNILQTVVFSDHKHMQCARDYRRWLQVSGSRVQRTSLGAGRWKREALGVSFEFLWSSY